MRSVTRVQGISRIERTLARPKLAKPSNSRQTSQLLGYTRIHRDESMRPLARYSFGMELRVALYEHAIGDYVVLYRVVIATARGDLASRTNRSRRTGTARQRRFPRRRDRRRKTIETPLFSNSVAFQEGKNGHANWSACKMNSIVFLSHRMIGDHEGEGQRGAQSLSLK